MVSLLVVKLSVHPGSSAADAPAVRRRQTNFRERNWNSLRNHAVPFSREGQEYDVGDPENQVIKP